ncbi:hypothetical protein KKA50_02055 [Patescibacteria group bacterium]|nr:hypothetical protein [Patescibacteria group bacterium]
MTRQLESLRLEVAIKKPVLGRRLKSTFQKLVAPGKYFEKDSKIGTWYPDFGKNIQLIVATGHAAKNVFINETTVYFKIWVMAEKPEDVSQEDYLKSLNDQNLKIVEQFQNLRDGFSKMLGHDL